MDYPLPDNLLLRDPSLIADDVEYAVRNAEFYLSHLAQWHVPLAGTSILELGPGPTLGTQLILASYGAQVHVADRFMPRWNDAFHRPFFAELLKTWGRPLPAVSASLNSGDFALTFHDHPAECMPSIPDGSIDIVFSNAVLEHVYDFRAVCNELRRVTRSCGFQSHQIDFRDHHDFSKPLEFLAQADNAHAIEFSESSGRFGNRIRPSEAREMFESSFSILQCWVDTKADPDYLTSFLPRLRASLSRYRDWPESDLVAVSARFVLRAI